MPRALETNAGIAHFLQTAEFFGLGLDYDVRLPDRCSSGDARRGECGGRGARSIPSRATIVIGRDRTQAVNDSARRLLRRRFHADLSGPDVQGEGYRAFCARHGIEVDAALFDRAVASAAPLLDRPDDAALRRRDLRALHAAHHRGDGRHAATRSTPARARSTHEWAACQHFELYDDVPPVLRELAAAGIRIGLISNSHRCLASFQSHFELQGLIAAAVSSSEHGFMKPHPSIFKAALGLVGVPPAEA